MSEHDIIVQTNNLSIGYYQGGQAHSLFEGLNIELKTGELVCFMGPNGIGKTSLIRTLAGLQKPLEGQFKIPRKQAMALVLTDKISATHMHVYDLISYGRYPYLNWNISLTKEDHRLINEAIALMNIDSIVHKKLYELSDGQLQMAMIAKALAQNTPVLFLDEPTAHLDLNNRVEIMNTLRQLSRTADRAILVATHELDLALQTADRIWLATKDKKIKVDIPEVLVLDGSFDQVFQFKGFDLKTGRVDHLPYRNIGIQLHGEGHEYLWTKNALERSGFEINESSPTYIKVKTDANTISWELKYEGVNITYDSLGEILDKLISLKT